MAKIKYKSGVADGATAIAHEFNTQNTFATAGAKLLSIKNAGAEKFALNKDGSDFSATPLKTWTVRPDEGGAAITTALSAAVAAGGGVVQLLAGTYVVSASITMVNGNNVTLQGMGDETILQHNNASTFATMSLSNSTDAKAANDTTKGNTSVYTTTPADASTYLAGDLVVVRGTRTDDGKGLLDLETNFVAANGNPTTGEVQLVTALKFTMTGISLRRSRNGRNNAIKNLKFTFTGANGNRCLNVAAGYRFLMENVTVDGGTMTGAYGVVALDGGAGSGMAGVDHVVRNCTFYNSTAAALGVFHQIGTLIERCTFRHTGSGGSAYDGAIALEREGRDILVKDCIITDVIIGCGIRVNGTARRRIRVEGCTIINCYNGGIYLDYESQVYNCNIENCGYGTTSAFFGGILLDGSTYGLCEASGNRIKHAKSGIYASTAHSTVVSNNICEDIIYYPIIIHDSCIAQNNICLDSTGGGYGIYLNGTQGIAHANLIKNCTTGIHVPNSVSKNIVSGNRILTSGTYAVDLAGAVTDNCLVVGNSYPSQAIRNNGTNNDFIANKV